MHEVAKSRTRLSDFTFTFHFHALEKEMATHSSVLAWSIPGTGKPGGLPFMGSHRVGHDWSDLAAAGVLQSLLWGSKDDSRVPGQKVSPPGKRLREVAWGREQSSGHEDKGSNLEHSYYLANPSQKSGSSFLASGSPSVRCKEGSFSSQSFPLALKVQEF